MKEYFVLLRRWLVECEALANGGNSVALHAQVDAHTEDLLVLGADLSIGLWPTP